MPRRTREQKIIAELRRKLNEQAPPSNTVETPPIAKIEVSLPSPIAKPIKEISKVSYEEPDFLKRDLTKFAVTVGVAATFEIIASYLILSGALKAVGLS